MCYATKMNLNTVPARNHPTHDSLVTAHVDLL